MTTAFLMQFGSHVYGTNLPTSDHDYKGIFIPTSREIILGTTKNTINHSTKPAGQLKNTAQDTDTEYFSLKQYMKLLLEGQTVALTMLFAPEQHILETSPIYEEIVNNKDRFLHKGVSAFAGYCRTQANKYGIKGSRVAAARYAMEYFDIARHYNFGTPPKLKDIWEDIVEKFTGLEHCEFPVALSFMTPVRMLSVCDRKVQEHITVKEAHKIYSHVFNEYGQRALQAEKQENIDWKALMHAVRVCGEAIELLSTHHITYPRPEASLLLQIRKGELPYQQVAELIEEGLIELEDVQSASTLPEKPDYQFAEDLVYDVYVEAVNYE